MQECARRLCNTAMRDVSPPPSPCVGHVSTSTIPIEPPTLTTSPPMCGCLQMYMLCTGSGRLNPRLRHTADTEGDRVKDLQAGQSG